MRHAVCLTRIEFKIWYLQTNHQPRMTNCTKLNQPGKAKANQLGLATNHFDLTERWFIAMDFEQSMSSMWERNMKFILVVVSLWLLVLNQCLRTECSWKVPLNRLFKRIECSSTVYHCHLFTLSFCRCQTHNATKDRPLANITSLNDQRNQWSLPSMVKSPYKPMYSHTCIHRCLCAHLHTRAQSRVCSRKHFLSSNGTG